jgi:hypothetical protein
MESRAKNKKETSHRSLFSQIFSTNFYAECDTEISTFTQQQTFLKNISKLNFAESYRAYIRQEKDTKPESSNLAYKMATPKVEQKEPLWQHAPNICIERSCHDKEH